MEDLIAEMLTSHRLASDVEAAQESIKLVIWLLQRGVIFRRDALQRFMAVYDAAGWKDLDRAHLVQDRLKELDAEYVARLAPD
jgi:hypothetical protein